ncbi:MAG: hypothetical protein COW27_02375 [Nitrosopumilales archaeon CG15_BIG_FIL_POST_REV_8_21_14_020_37_12]|nr:MAG: hypothetical protein COW27_02375 [Nitrosopumilales archaeon CG15_BIG_FIL_POST_REV_8_21_14_020_37_12]
MKFYSALENHSEYTYEYKTEFVWKISIRLGDENQFNLAEIVMKIHVNQQCETPSDFSVLIFVNFS